MSLQLSINHLSKLMLKDSQKQKAEIAWVIVKSVSSGYSNNSCTDISKLFTCMFPDSKIARSFELGATKPKLCYQFQNCSLF